MLQRGRAGPQFPLGAQYHRDDTVEYWPVKDCGAA